MLTELHIDFQSREQAQRALTDLRKEYRIALRGACITGPDYFNCYRVHVPLGNTGFSNAEMCGAIRANPVKG